MQQQRDPHQLFSHVRWRMIAAAVIEKFFAVIRGHGHDAVLPPAEALQRVHQAGQLRIDPPDTRIVERNHLFAVPPQPVGTKIAAVPIGIQISRPRRIERILPHECERFLLGVVRRMRIHEVQPQKKWLTADAAQPVPGMVNHHIGGGEAAQLVERERR